MSWSDMDVMDMRPQEPDKCRLCDRLTRNYYRNEIRQGICPVCQRRILENEEYAQEFFKKLAEDAITNIEQLDLGDNLLEFAASVEEDMRV